MYTNAAGLFALPGDGGKLPEKKPQTSLKFANEARALFGCAMRKKVDGVWRESRQRF